MHRLDLAAIAINRVTNDKPDSVAKIPELKYCAIRVTADGTALLFDRTDMR